MSAARTFLSSPAAPLAEQLEVEACLRRVLDRMASSLDDAYELYPHGGVGSLVMAKRYAAFLGTGGERGPPGGVTMGTWFASGPYAGLSIVSGVLSDMGVLTAFENVQDLAELRYHAQDLMIGVPPFADEMQHGPFQETYARLRATVEESREM